MITDIIIIIILLLAAYFGYRKGLVSRVLQLGKYVVAFIVAQMTAGIVGGFLASIFVLPEDWLVKIGTVSLGLITGTTIWQSISFIVIFIVVAVILGRVVKGINFENWIIVGWLSRVGGIFLNVAIWYIIIFFAVFLIRIFAFSFFQEYLEPSIIIQFMLQFMW